MAIFSIEIEDADVARVLTALCVNYNREDTADNPEEELQFTNRRVREV